MRMKSRINLTLLALAVLASSAATYASTTNLPPSPIVQATRPFKSGGAIDQLDLARERLRGLPRTVPIHGFSGGQQRAALLPRAFALA
jgi:hypothetical protein